MFIILFTWLTHKKYIQHFKSYSTLKSTIVQYNSRHPRADVEWTGKKSYWLEEGEEVGDCRADVSKVVDGGRAAILLTPNVGVTGSGSLLHSSIATLLKKCSSDFLEVEIKYHTHEKKGTGLSTFLFLGIGDMVALDCILNLVYHFTFGFCASKLNSASSNKDNPLTISCS